MKNTVCRSDTCPNCGAPRVSEIESIPVQGRIQVERRYSCGRRVQYSYEIAGIHIEPECGASRKRTRAKP